MNEDKAVWREVLNKVLGFILLVTIQLGMFLVYLIIGCLLYAKFSGVEEFSPSVWIYLLAALLTIVMSFFIRVKGIDYE